MNLTANWNLPPGVTIGDLDRPDEDAEFDRELEKADAENDIARDDEVLQANPENL